jgi:DNA-damage-inducible protein J
MSKAITVRIDENVKQQAEDMLNEIGLNMTTYITSSLRALVREKKVPFELTTKQQTNAEYLAKLDESIAQAERGEVVKYSMDELKALVEE